MKKRPIVRLSYTKIILATLLFLVLSFPYMRSFHTINGVTFTIWKTSTGCYIMPYRYFGLSDPPKDYLKVANLAYLTIIVKDQNNLIVFHNRSDAGLKEWYSCIESMNYEEFMPAGYFYEDGHLKFRAEDYFKDCDSLAKKKEIYINSYPCMTVDVGPQRIYIAE